ncbi:ATP-dependent DNA helicase [Shewanella maritima]|uniref:ATP-dependent DNA helicase n=1 Tax=Shewanella maritima TaxID=2520507 RepID=UPI003735D079
MLSLSQSVEQVFSATGPLAKNIADFRARQPQVDMAVAISKSISAKKSTNKKLIVEAGTGVGKTYAYLVPALLSDKQVIISTGSKNLQEQLFFKDLPALLKMLDIAPKVSLLKGRSNYVCQLRLDNVMQDASRYEQEFVDDLLLINQWATLSKDGDIGNLNSVSEDSDVLPTVVSTKESCKGKKCDFYDECFTRKARVKALEAKVIVVNHHLFFADRLLKDTGFAELLPDPDVVVFDEAHLLPDTCINYFGDSISGRQIDRLLTALIELHKNEIRDSIQIEQVSFRALTVLNQWQQALAENNITNYRSVLANKHLANLGWQLIDSLKALETLLKAHLGRFEALDDTFEKLVVITERLQRFCECNDANCAYSVDTNQRHIQLSVAPINIAQQCQALFDDKTAWVFTSATMQMNRKLDHFANEMGLIKAKQLILDSPFDYANQAIFCVPRNIGNRGAVSHMQAGSNYHLQQFVDVCVRAVNAAQGRTFILFTSHQMMTLTAQLLVNKIRYPMLVQGQASKQTILNKYRQLGNAVLLGTASFWEGVDVRGKLLSCVIIDKLPFVSPDDTLYKARSANVEQQGQDPFACISLPQAVISLKQGVGRLIRDEKDQGVLILCDNRIVNRAYGQAFLQSLPPMSRTRDLDAAIAFLQSIK